MAKINNQYIEVSGKKIGRSHPCFIIAEAGSNHDRKLKQAFKLIDIAKEAGCDAVKFQTYSAEKLYSKKTPAMSYLKKGKLLKKGESIWELIKRIEMPREWHPLLAEHCKHKDIIFLSTPFDIEAVDELEEVDMPAYKVASFEINHIPLLEKIAKTKKPVILSTGMANLRDIRIALDTIYRFHRKVCLLHCAINYPPLYKDLNLNAIKTIEGKFKVPVGFSDHTLGVTSSVVAVALGACIIEKHFTISRLLKGPDHGFALEPQELKKLVQDIRSAQESLGVTTKKCTQAEEEMYKLARRSLVAACDIQKGTKIKRNMLDVKRPGFGISPTLLKTLIGKIAKKNIKEDDILTWNLF